MQNSPKSRLFFVTVAASVRCLLFFIGFRAVKIALNLDRKKAHNAQLPNEWQTGRQTYRTTQNDSFWQKLKVNCTFEWQSR